MEEGFYNKLSQYIGERDTRNANRLVMQELGKSLVKDRADFISLLKYADVPVSGSELDAELIDRFIDNIDNRKLMIGAAYMVNHRNKTAGFDGQDVVSDTGTKAVYKVMYNYFNGPGESHSNASGVWGQAIDSVAKLGGGVLDQQRSKKQGATDALYKKQDAKNAIVQQVLSQRQAQQDAAVKKAAEKSKTQRILIWSGAGVLVIAVAAFGIYMYKKRKS